MNDAAEKNPMDAGSIVAAALIVSAVGALFYNVLPLYLGAAQDYRELDNRAIGFLSSAFFLGYNVVTISAFFWIRNVSWSLITAIATPVAAASLYAGTLTHSYAGLLLATTVSGGAFAALYGVGTTILSDTSNPARWYGVKIAVEAFPGILLMLVLPSTAIARWGFDGAVIGIILFMIFLVPFLFWIPAHGKDWSGENIRARDGQGNRQNMYIWGSLVATLVFFAGASAMWAFIERIGARGSFDSAAVGVLLSATLVFAVVGSLFAATIGGRFGNVRPFMAGAVVLLASLYLLHDPVVFSAYAIGACVFTLAFGFILPIAVTEVAELDTDGRYVVLSVPAIGIGAMTGPGVGGLLTQAGDFGALIMFAAACMVFSTLLITFAASKAREV